MKTTGALPPPYTATTPSYSSTSWPSNLKISVRFYLTKFTQNPLSRWDGNDTTKPPFVKYAWYSWPEPAMVAKALSFPSSFGSTNASNLPYNNNESAGFDGMCL